MRGSRKVRPDRRQNRNTRQPDVKMCDAAKLSEDQKLCSTRVTFSESLAVWSRVGKCYKFPWNNAAIDKVQTENLNTQLAKSLYGQRRICGVQLPEVHKLALTSYMYLHFVVYCIALGISQTIFTLLF